ARAQLGLEFKPLDSAKYSRVKQIAAEIAALGKDDSRIKKLAGEMAELSKNDPRLQKLADEVAAQTKENARIQELAKQIADSENDASQKKLQNDPAELAKKDPRAKSLADELNELTKEDPRVRELAAAIAKLSQNEPYSWVKVPAGATLKMPLGEPDYEAKDEMLLKDGARQGVGRERKDRDIVDTNRDKLKLRAELPVGAELKLPTQDWPAWIAFAGLALFLLLVGIGKLLGQRPSEEEPAAINDGMNSA